MTAMPTRIEHDLYDAAKSAGATMSRSAAQQINHWARIGRELEAARGVSGREVADVLEGRARYDSLSARDQAIVRADWDESIVAAAASLDLEAEFISAGHTWVEAAPDGTTVLRDPDEPVAPKSRRRRTT